MDQSTNGFEDIQHNPGEPYRQQFMEEFQRAITFGTHCDEDGPNAANNYVLAMVVDAHREHNIPFTFASAMYAVGVWMEMVQTHFECYDVMPGFTFDMPMDFNKDVYDLTWSEVRRGIASGVELPLDRKREA